MDQKSPGSDLFKTGYGYIAAKTSEFDISNQLLSNLADNLGWATASTGIKQPSIGKKAQPAILS